MASAETNDEKLGSKMEITLFSIVGCSYLGVGAWILMKKLHTPIPYAIVAVGSAVMIGIYMVAITGGIPVFRSRNRSRSVRDNCKDPTRRNNWNSRILDTFHSKDFRKNAKNKQIANDSWIKEFTHNLQLESMGRKNLPTTSGHYCY